MYCFESMIEMGLKKDQSFPTVNHRKVALTLVMGNPKITSRDTFTEIVQSVLKVPTDLITKVTFIDLAKDYGCPVVW